MIYRLLFLLFAEARALVPMWNRIYRDGYSVDALRQACDKPAEAVGLWPALLAISRLAHHGCSTETLRVTAFNGRLFSPSSAPLVEQAAIDDTTMTAVLRALTDAARSTPHEREGARIFYGDLDVEQLGTIYEHVLDFAPALEAVLGRARTRGPERSEPATPRRRAVSARRKESGTFYTPRAMAEYLVRTTLTPLVREASSEAILRLRVLDPAMGSGAFLVAACRFLADACQRALEREGALSHSEPPRVQRARLRRAVARHCLYGVDVNPVAVQLARLSLWLTTLAADVPLTFLDHHLCVGDSLVGASIDDLTRGWSTLRDSRSRRAHNDPSTLPLFETDEVSQLMQGLMPTRARLCDPDDSVEVVRDKEHALTRSLTDSALSRWLSLADVWCARWFWADARDAPPVTAWHEVGDHLLRESSALPARVPEGWVRHAAAVAAEQRFLHWGLQFPEIFVDAQGRQRGNGGFDAVVSNPPWDMVRADTHEEGRRDESRRAASALGRLVRESGLYRGGSEGHLNRYQLFVARALSLARSGGRVGLIVPWGLAGDSGQRAAAAHARRAVRHRHAGGLRQQRGPLPHPPQRAVRAGHDDQGRIDAGDPLPAGRALARSARGPRPRVDARQPRAVGADARMAPSRVRRRAGAALCHRPS